MMRGTSELRLNCVARPEVAKPIRHAIAAFFSVFELDEDFLEDMLTAIGEALANAIEHAYAGRPPADDVEIVARWNDAQTIAVDVFDRGRFIERERQENRGFGLRIVRAIAVDVRIDTEGGTRVHMEFRAPVNEGVVGNP